MARNMSVALTTQQVINETKDVTRRMGWLFVKVGDELNLVNKTMGFKKGERPISYKRVRVISTRRELLNSITPSDCTREGFPHLSPAEFVTMFCQHNKCTPETMVTRIEWEYLMNPVAIQSGCPIPSEQNVCGFTSEEQIVMDKLLEGFASFCKLERQHPSEMSEFVDSLHRLQGVLAMRVIRRSYPTGWPTYK